MKKKLFDSLPHIIFALVTVAAVCLTIALVGECKMGKRLHKVQACVEIDPLQEELSSEAPKGMKCETTQAGDRILMTCCTP